jgi:hypothetical protein
MAHFDEDLGGNVEAECDSMALKFLLKNIFWPSRPRCRVFLSDAECGNIPFDSDL